ncbi:uncharacterized protein METZ01_LOCUS399930, partial [marine metagenome]
MRETEIKKDGIHEYYYKHEYSHQLKWRGHYKKGVKNGVVEIFHWKHGHLVRREHW